jgi:hypothetical protein
MKPVSMTGGAGAIATRTATARAASAMTRSPNNAFASGARMPGRPVAARILVPRAPVRSAYATGGRTTDRAALRTTIARAALAPSKYVWTVPTTARLAIQTIRVRPARAAIGNASGVRTRVTGVRRIRTAPAAHAASSPSPPISSCRTTAPVTTIPITEGGCSGTRWERRLPPM